MERQCATNGELHCAVVKGFKQCAHAIRKAGGMLGWDEARSSAELCEAAKAGNLSQVALMLQVGADVNAVDYDKRSCLHLASSVGNLKLVEYLLSHDANINAVDRWGGTPLRDAVREGHRSVALLLHKRGGELGFTEAQASGELCEFAKKGDMPSVELLLACGADPDAADCTCALFEPPLNRTA